MRAGSSLMGAYWLLLGDVPEQDVRDRASQLAVGRHARREASGITIRVERRGAGLRAVDLARCAVAERVLPRQEHTCPTARDTAECGSVQLGRDQLLQQLHSLLVYRDALLSS